MWLWGDARMAWSVVVHKGGNAYLQDGKRAEARAAFERAIAREPTLPNSYYALVDMKLSEKDWAGVSSELTRAAAALGVDFTKIEQAEGFEEYVKTDEYRRWKAEQKGRKGK